MIKPTLIWSLKKFEDLNTRELYQILALRTEVFIVEQNCPYQDCDYMDYDCWHLCGSTDAGEVLAYLRILPPGLVYEEIAMGRIVTSPRLRRTGYGHLLMEKGFEFVFDFFGKQAIRISAQTYLLDFYKSLGFESTGKEYLEDDIPHTEMLKK